MSEKILVNNQVTIVGEIISEFEYSHDVFGEKFYTANILVERLSDSHDVIPILVSERLFDTSLDCRGFIASVSGQFRSYNQHDGNRSRLVLSVFAREITIIDELPEESSLNHIELIGYPCREPVYRKTPYGREITDLLLAVNRPYGKSDYIPCICWGRNARYAESFRVGECIKVAGRIQSREYQKRISETETETRTAYEVSVSLLEEYEGDIWQR